MLRLRNLLHGHASLRGQIGSGFDRSPGEDGIQDERDGSADHDFGGDGGSHDGILWFDC
jgi:hypothetical protein